MEPIDYSSRLRSVIPGGAHTYSRGDDQYPSNAPAILASGQGCYVYDAEGNEYLDYGMALRAVTIGYGRREVADAAYAEILKGNNLTRASVTELRAAEKLLELFPSSHMVKFGKNGSTVTSAAVKLARAYTGRTHIAFPEEQPFFSYDDWFIGSTPMDRGIPYEGRSLSIRFKYNDIASVQRLFDAHPNQIACIIMEPTTYVAPCLSSQCPGSHTRTNCRDCPEGKKTFLHEVKRLCAKHGAVFILDEMITGFRWHLSGAQYFFDVEPDLATFGKGMANGFSVAALVGKREIMKIGGITDSGEERVFLISTTHGAEMCGLGAFMKTVDLYRELSVTDHLWNFGARFIDQLNALAAEAGIKDHFRVEGYPCSPSYFTRDAEGSPSLGFRTLFAQEMMKSRILLPWIALSYAHGDAELARTLEAARAAFHVYGQALESGLDKFLVGNSVKPVFRKNN